MPSFELTYSPNSAGILARALVLTRHDICYMIDKIGKGAGEVYALRVMPEDHHRAYLALKLAGLR